MKKRALLNGMMAIAFTTSFLTGCSTKNDAVSQAEKTEKDRPSVSETKAIAEDGFVYGLPIVMNYAVMYEYAVNPNSGQFKAPFNQIHNEAGVFTYKDTAIISPNSDTPYSMAWLDLRAEPIVLSVPAVPKNRYFSVMLCDGNTYNYGYIGSRATGNEAGNYMVVGPDWNGETPAAIKKVFRSGTQFSAAAYRTQLFNPADMPNVIKVQAGYKVQPLSAFLHKPAPAAAPAIDFPKIDKDMIKTGFFDYLDFALQFAPATPDEKEIRSTLARIGVGPGKTFNFKDLDAEHKAEVLLGMKDGEDKITAAIASMGKNVSGWRVGGLAGGDRAFFNGDWLKRAATAKAGIYANDPAESDVSHGCRRQRWTATRCQQAQLHSHIPQGTASPGECFLVGNDVRWQVAVADRESDQSLPDQYTDVAADEKECRRIPDDLHAEQDAGEDQRIQLASGSRCSFLRAPASLLAENRTAVDPTAWRGHLESARHRGCELRN